MHPDRVGDSRARRPERSARIALIALSTLLLAFSAIAIAWFTSNGNDQPMSRLQPLPVIATLPDFSLVERDGRQISRSDLLGHVWVADFIFTNCAGPCPTLSLRMRSIHESLSNRDPKADVKLVSFTLDPAHDTPEVLRAYADRLQADPKRWWFLTGVDEKAMHQLVEKGFLQAVKAATANSQIIHSTYFVIVDRAGRIRAVHDGLDPNSKPLILRDVDRLLAERP